MLNASRRFRYTLDLKKEEEKKQVLRKIRAHAQAIRVRYPFFLVLSFGIEVFLSSDFLFLAMLGCISFQTSWGSRKW